MKKINYSIILILSILIGSLLFFIPEKSNTNFIDQEIVQSDKKYVYFKIKYDIKIKNDFFIPSKIENKNNDINSREFILNNKLDYLEYNFKIESNNNLTSNNQIFLYPKEHIELIRTSRFFVTNVFFESRGVSQNVSTKSVKILTNINKDWNECNKELKKIYVGSQFNINFYNEAIPKLIF